jgi:glycosyltransferase involved in cell wall biosynthesis
MRSDSKARRVLYLQFYDPAGYPPLEHSSRMFAARDWAVKFIGVMVSRDAKLKMPTHANIRVTTIGLDGIWRFTPIRYFRFLCESLFCVLFWRPALVYGSDPNVLPVLSLVQKLSRSTIIYHEHDSPSADLGKSRFQRLVARCRTSVGRSADVCILPQQQRLEAFVQQVQRRRPTLCVWNCPSAAEISDRSFSDETPLLLYYHGSINAARLPLELIDAICRFHGAVRFIFAGYEVQGSIGYVDEMLARARHNGAPSAVQYMGAIPMRDDLFRLAQTAHVGISLMPMTSDDINLRHMVGASNKPFDCMASGLPLLVSQLDEWTSTFVDAGYARACDPRDTDSIERELRWYLDNPQERMTMARNCVAKARSAWNYEHMFEGVVTAAERASQSGHMMISARSAPDAGALS